MMINIFRQESVRIFLKRGCYLSVALFAAGLSGLVFSVALASVSLDATAAHGVGWFLLSTLSLPLTGFRFFVVGQKGAVTEKIDGLPEGLLLVNFLILFLFIVISLTLSYFEYGLFDHLTLFLIFRGLGIPLTALNSVLSGYLVRAGCEKILLRITFESIFLHLIAATLLIVIPTTAPVLLLGYVGFVGLSIQVYVCCRYVRILRLSKRLIDIFIPHNCWKKGYMVGKTALAAGGDVIILSSTFWIVLTSLGAVDPMAAAYTSIGFSIVRTFVVPLKSFGLVAGRMLNAAENEIELRRRERAFFLTMLSICSFLSLFSLLIYASKNLTATITPSLFWQSNAPLIFLAIAIQIAIEPWASFRAAVMKVTMSPFVALLALAMSLWAMVLPVILSLSVFSLLTLESTWITLIFGRLLFACLLQFQAQNGFMVSIRSPQSTA